MKKLTAETMQEIKNGDKIRIYTCESTVEGVAEVLGMEHPALEKLRGGVLIIRSETGCILIGKKTVKEGAYSFENI